MMSLIMDIARRGRRRAVVFLAAACVIAGCKGEVTAPPQSVPDAMPPGSVTVLSAFQDDGAITLTWTNPFDEDWSGTLVRRSVSGPPADPAAPGMETDTVVYDGAGDSFTDSGLRHDVTYYYTVFSYDATGNFARGVSTSATSFYKPFTLIALPDTQYYSLDYPELFNTHVQWIADNKDAENIVFVMHEGDITHNNTDAEWANASAAMGILDGVVPYAPSVGNHDMSGRDTTKFNTYFPVSRFQGLPSFGGVFEAGKMDNSFHLFRAGGTDWLVMSLEYDPRDEALDWANQVAASYPDRRIILVTHAYVDPYNRLSSIGRNIWNKFARYQKNLTFVFNGHYTDGDSGRLVSTGDNGNKVYQMFANYQTLYFGGLGYLRVVRCDPSARTVSVKTYSPWLQTYKEDDGNQFVFEDVDISPPGD